MWGTDCYTDESSWAYLIGYEIGEELRDRLAPGLEYAGYLAYVPAMMSGKGPQGSGKKFLKFTKGNLRENLSRLSGIKPIDSHGHHTLPIKFESKFNKAGIKSIHNPVYGAWWKGTLHSQNWYKYNQKWELFFKTQTVSISNIHKYAKQLAKEFNYKVWF